MNLLFNAQHEIRSGWRFLLYWVVFAFLLIVITLPFPGGPRTQLERLVLNTIPIFPALAALVFMARFVDRRPLSAYGVSFHEGWSRDFVLGCGLAAAMLVLLTVANVVTGGVTMTGNAANADTKSLMVTAVVLIMSAAQEEIIFRGYPLQTLMKGVGTWPAIIAMSAAFGFVHYRYNPNATVIGAVNTALAGLLLSIAYLKTRSLWLPYGIHLAWNLGLGFVMGYTLSGIEIDSLWRSEPLGPKWLVGGQYGPEEGFVATVVFTAAVFAVRATRAAGVSPQVRAALAPNAGKIHISEN
jgi:membrane protease YdiL (CAAX protease family)